MSDKAVQKKYKVKRKKDNGQKSGEDLEEINKMAMLGFNYNFYFYKLLALFADVIADYDEVAIKR